MAPTRKNYRKASCRRQSGGGGMGLMSGSQGVVYMGTKKRKASRRRQAGGGGMGLMSGSQGVVYMGTKKRKNSRR